MSFHRLKSDSAQRGFGLLEAIVSLALISSIGFALLAWVQQSIDSMQRVKVHYRDMALERAVLDWSENLNPMEDSTGSFDYDGFHVAWESRREGDVAQQSGYPMGVGIYDVALFTVEVVVTGHEGEVMRRAFRRLGYEKVRAGRALFQ